MNRMYARWSESPVILGTWLKLGSVVTTEMTVDAGFDFVVVDLEHSALSPDWIYTVCAIAQPRGVAVLVRVPDPQSRELSRILDTGVDGILFPQLRSVDDLVGVTSRTRFPPHGTRGMGLTSRAGSWGTASAQTYRRHSDDDLFRCVQFETPPLLEAVDVAMGTKAFDAALLGTADLACELGVEQDDPRVLELGDQLLAAAIAGGVSCGTAVGSAEQAAQSAARGFSFIVVSNDATTYATGINRLARDTISAVRG
jgi:2-keto-3-deoxy-L-rhamnonate aldolase RhmA